MVFKVVKSTVKKLYSEIAFCNCILKNCSSKDFSPKKSIFKMKINRDNVTFLRSFCCVEVDHTQIQR